MIRILLADDQALIRSGIRSLLEAEDDIEVIAEATDGHPARRAGPGTLTIGAPGYLRVAEAAAKETSAS